MTLLYQRVNHKSVTNVKNFAFYLKNLQNFYFILSISTDKLRILPPKVKKFKKISRTTREPRGTVLAGENRPWWIKIQEGGDFPSFPVYSTIKVRTYELRQKGHWPVW